MTDANVLMAQVVCFARLQRVAYTLYQGHHKATAVLALFVGVLVQIEDSILEAARRARQMQPA